MSNLENIWKACLMRNDNTFNMSQFLHSDIESTEARNNYKTKQCNSNIKTWQSVSTLPLLEPKDLDSAFFHRGS